jgi:hypothetical protein
VPGNGPDEPRVEITGFPAVYDAKTYAVTAKKQLGLNEAWIMKD